MKRKKIALYINMALFGIEMITFLRNIITTHSFAIQFYTNDSNLLALITSFLFICSYQKEKEIIKDLRFITTSCLTVTFLVVLFVLSPMYQFNYKLLMFTGEMFIYHTLCPILSFISYVFFEPKSNKNYLGFLFTMTYAIILLFLNILKIVDGPYPFLQVYNQSIITSILWFIGIVGGSYLIGVGINQLNKNKKGAKH